VILINYMPLLSRSLVYFRLVRFVQLASYILRQTASKIRSKATGNDYKKVNDGTGTESSGSDDDYHKSGSQESRIC
jgi:hypothetical protein